MTDKRPPPTRGQPAAGASITVADEPQFKPRNGLTPVRLRFAQEFALCLNGTEAYMRASPDTDASNAASIAHQLLKVPAVVDEVQRLLDERAMITGITADRVLTKAWEIANADVRELVEIEVGSCRHCWGMYHQYQYTESEFANAQDKHIREQAAKAKKDDSYEAKPFPERGGTGYDPRREPNAECPECWGDGKQRVRIHDTRKLSPGVAALYAGVKQDKHGNISVVIEDRAVYLQIVARYLGMDKRILAGDPDNPLYVLLQQIQQQRSTLPVVTVDPELTQAGAMETVKPAPGAVSRKPPATPWRAKG